MSALPRPLTEETPSPATGVGAAPPAQAAAAADAEGWALLEGLRRRLDEQANSHRKTQTQVGQLAESIGSLVEAQRRRSRWVNINSFVAYLVFTCLCGGAFYLLYQSRARELVADRDRVAHERELATDHSKKVSDQLSAREAADTRAFDAYHLLEAGKRDEASKKLAELAGAPLSKLERSVLDAKAKQADVMQVDATLKNVAAAFKAGRQGETIGPLEVALGLEPVGPRAALMHYYLGVAYAKAGTLDRSITHLKSAVDGEVDQEDARFQYASALDRAGQWGRAKVEYERFATAHPMSPHTTFATRRSWGLARLPELAPDAIMAVPAAAATTPTPTPAPIAAPTPTTTAPIPPTAPPAAAATTTPPTAAAPAPDAAEPAMPGVPNSVQRPAAPKPAAPKPAAPKPAAAKTAPKTAAPKQPAAPPPPAPKTLDFNEPE